MNRLSSLALIIFVLFISISGARADIPALQNLTTSDANKALDNLAAALYFRSVEPPSSNGTIWGFGLGVVGSATTMSQIKSVTGKNGMAPAADIALSAQAPLGIALEVGFIPSITISSGKIKRGSFNLKWTWTDVFPMPVTSALRLGFGATSFSWHDTGANADYGYKARFTQFQASISKKLAIFEPYLGLGLISQTSNLSVTGSTPVANGQFSFGRKSSSFWMSGGAQLSLLILSLGAQVDRALGETSLSLRLGFKI